MLSVVILSVVAPQAWHMPNRVNAKKRISQAKLQRLANALAYCAIGDEKLKILTQSYKTFFS
jgi:hypothetical protein